MCLTSHLLHATRSLKLDYANLNMKYQELDLAFDALDEELKETQKKVIKVNIATSCDDIVELPHPTTCHHALLLVQRLTMIGRNNLRRNLKA